MPLISSPPWNFELGVCEKHSLPEVPCRQCIATKDEDITVSSTQMDRMALGLDNTLEFRDLLPAKDADWLMERIE